MIIKFDHAYITYTFLDCSKLFESKDSICRLENATLMNIEIFFDFLKSSRSKWLFNRHSIKMNNDIISP